MHFQIKAVEHDGYLEVNFFLKTTDSWNVLNTSHTILESDITKVIDKPDLVKKS